MSRSWLVIFGALLLAGVAAGIAYNAGLHQGIAQSAKIVVPPAGAYPYPYPYYAWHPGFPIFPFLFFIFLFFIFARGVFWRARWRHGHYRCGYHDEEKQNGMNNVSV